MMLSNFLLFSVFRKNFYYNCQGLKPETNLVIRNLRENLSILNNNRYSKMLVANSTSLISDPSVESKRINLLPRNMWQKFINEFVQETIFLSNSNHESSRYVNKLRTLGIAVYKGNEYRHFLNQFSKDLVNGKIVVEVDRFKNVDNNTTLYKQSSEQCLKYVWFKFMNFRPLESKSISTNSNQFKLVNHSLPLFVVVNDSNQIVMSESTDQLHHNDILLKLKSFFLTNHNKSKKMYTGLIFISPEDALEYKNYVESCYYNSTRSVNLSVVPTNMNTYYKFLSIGSYNFDFRLMPDLKEVSDLVYRHRKYSNLSFDIFQKYGKQSFQGQPIYFIKPFTYKHKNIKTLNKFKYNQYFSQNNFYFECKAVFLNYQTLVDMWQKFVKDNKFNNLPAVPNVHVSNLETFVSKSYYKDNHSKLIFLPSLQSYDFIKNYLIFNSDKQSGIYNVVANRLFHIKTFCYRILWSLTVRQPVNL